MTLGMSLPGLVGLLVVIGVTNGEVFTAMTDMSHLLTTEGEMIRTVENYILAQEKRLERMKM